MDTFPIRKESVFMPESETKYPTEFREKIVALVRDGRSVEDLTREFELCSATIQGWVKAPR
jgi:transposase-like protein